MESRKFRGAKPRITDGKDLALKLRTALPPAMPSIVEQARTVAMFPEDMMRAMRLHSQMARIEFVERRQDPFNPGVIEMYCRFCDRLIVASRDEFVLPIAVKAHKCAENFSRRRLTRR